MRVVATNQSGRLVTIRSTCSDDSASITSEQALRAEFGGAAQLDFFQSNHEGALIDQIASLADQKFAGLVINGGAFTHTSVALRDALLSAHLPAVEVHISNIYKREEFRHQSLTAPACVAVITGLGLEGYHAAVRFLLKS